MKTPARLALFLSLASSAFAGEIAFTAPVGYTAPATGADQGYTIPMGNITETLRPGMNILGLRLHESVIASGHFASLGSDFAELTGLGENEDGSPKLPLIKGKTYILEIASGAKAGVIQEITSWQGTRLTLAEDLAAAGVKPGDHFNIRQASTLNSVLDPRHTSLRKGASLANADIVLIPNGATFGDFRPCFIFSAPGIPATWVDSTTNKPIGDLPLIYPDGLIVKITGETPITVTFSGEIKPGPTRSIVNPGLNLIATPFPVRDHLQGLGLENDLVKGSSPIAADCVWVADSTPNGPFSKYYLDQEGRWIDATHNTPVAQKIPVGSAILIERVGPAALFCLGD